MAQNKVERQISPDEEKRRAQIQWGRQLFKAYSEWLWERWQDEMDIFDLRYLFDHDEVQDDKRELIEYEETYGQNPRYYRYMLYANDDDETLELQPENADYQDTVAENVQLPPENWDDSEW